MLTVLCRTIVERNESQTSRRQLERRSDGECGAGYSRSSWRSQRLVWTFYTIFCPDLLRRYCRRSAWPTLFRRRNEWKYKSSNNKDDEVLRLRKIPRLEIRKTLMHLLLKSSRKSRQLLNGKGYVASYAGQVKLSSFPHQTGRLSASNWSAPEVGGCRRAIIS